MTKYVDPNFLPSLLDTALNETKECGYLYALKMQQIQEIYKENSDLDHQIEQISMKIQNEKGFMDNSESIIQNLQKECENLQKENDDKKEELFKSIMDNCTYETYQGEYPFKYLNGVEGATPLVFGNILKSFLLAQKTKLFRLYDTHRKLTQNVFCLVDEDPENYKISENLDFPQNLRYSVTNKFEDAISQSEIPDYIPESNYSKSIISQIDIPQMNQSNNGVEFEVINMFNTDSKRNYLVDTYIHKLRDRSQKSHEKVLSLLNDIEKLPVPDVDYSNPTLKSPSFTHDTANTIKDAQNAINRFATVISMGHISQIETENAIHEQLTDLVDSIKSANKNLSNFFHQGKIQPINTNNEQKETSVHVIPPSQVEKTFDLAESADEVLREVSTQQNLMIENMVSIQNQLRENEVLAKSTPISSSSSIDISDIIKLQDEIVQKQNEEFNEISEIFELLPQNIKDSLKNIPFPGKESLENNSEPNLDLDFEIPKLTPKYKPKQSSNSDLLATVRSRKYLYYSRPEDLQIQQRVVEEENKIQKIYDDWLAKNFTYDEAKDPIAIAAELNGLKEQLQQKEELLSKRKQQNAINEDKNKTNVPKREQLQKSIGDLQKEINVYEKGLKTADDKSAKFRDLIREMTKKISETKLKIDKKEKAQKVINELTNKINSIDDYIKEQKQKIKEGAN